MAHLFISKCPKRSNSSAKKNPRIQCRKPHRYSVEKSRYSCNSAEKNRYSAEKSTDTMQNYPGTVQKTDVAEPGDCSDRKKETSFVGIKSDLLPQYFHRFYAKMVLNILLSLFHRCTCTCTHTHTHTHTHTCTSTHVYTQTHSHKHTQVWTQTYMYVTRTHRHEQTSAFSLPFFTLI